MTEQQQGVHLQFCGWFVSLSVKPNLGTVDAYVIVQSGHRVVSFFHLVGVSASVRQPSGDGSGCFLQPLRRN